jgi:hypothetical protein
VAKYDLWFSGVKSSGNRGNVAAFLRIMPAGSGKEGNPGSLRARIGGAGMRCPGGGAGMRCPGGGVSDGGGLALPTCGLLWLLHMFQEFFLVDICLPEN